MNKKKIYIDFEMFIADKTGAKLDYHNVKPAQGIEEFLIALNNVCKSY